MARKDKGKNNQNNESLEKKLWKAARYKHIVLSFLKYISDAFLQLHKKLKECKGEYEWGKSSKYGS